MTLSNTEHFVTLFDSGFLPLGMALHESLMEHAQPFHLWVVCMDETVEEQLKQLALPHLSPIPLASLETPELLAIKGGRSRAEYCWTVTPFTFRAVFDRDADVNRVTYLDSDLYFFSSPRILLRELDAAGKDVLITEHAYAPENAECLVQNGRFCVQFLTLLRNDDAERVRKWWQDKCVEWCFDRFEDGKFGDQKYLDLWPDLFGDHVHIVQQTYKTLAPWNEKYFETIAPIEPVFYHFHGFRIISRKRVQLYSHYAIGRQGLSLYKKYVDAISRSLRIMRKSGFALPIHKVSLRWKMKIRLTLKGKLGYANYSL